MTSAWVLIIASVLHFGLRRSCFLNVEQLPVLAETLLARHIAYCAMLHFLYDLELLPQRYRRRMGLLIGFLVELVLGIAFMEVLGQWLWFRVEHLVHRCILLALCRYGGGGELNDEMFMYLERAFMRGVMTTLAALFWLNAYAATEPKESKEPQVATAAEASLDKSKHRPPAKATCCSKSQEELAQQQDQKQKLRQKMKLKMKLILKKKEEQHRKQLEEQEQSKEKEKENPQLPVAAAAEEAKLSASPEEQHLTVLAATSDC